MDNLKNIIRIKTLDHIDDIKKQKLAYIDFDTVIKENVKNINNNDPMTLSRTIDEAPMTTMTMQVHTKDFENAEILETDNTNNIIIDILDRLYNKVKDINDNIHTIDNSEIDNNVLNRKLVSKILELSNMIAVKCKRGPATCVIIPHHFYKIYENLLQSMNLNKMKMYINYTDTHTDRIIIFRNDSELTNPGMMLFVDTNLDKRYLKLQQIIKKINKNIKIKINYVIDEIGNIENNIQVLQLKNFD